MGWDALEVRQGPAKSTLEADFYCPEYLDVSLTVRTLSLKPRPHTAYQLELLRKVVYLREQEKLTFRGVAQKLAASEYQSARGKSLSPELVFSTYKKRPAA